MKVTEVTATGRQHPRSAATGSACSTHPESTGQQSFAVNGPATWNRLPRQHYTRRILDYFVVC